MSDRTQKIVSWTRLVIDEVRRVASEVDEMRAHEGERCLHVMTSSLGDLEPSERLILFVSVGSTTVDLHFGLGCGLSAVSSAGYDMNLVGDRGLHTTADGTLTHLGRELLLGVFLEAAIKNDKGDTHE